MQKILAYLVLLLLPLATRGQALSEWYYWFDTDTVPQKSGQVSDQKFRLEADVSNLSTGAHTLFVQVADTAGVYSPPLGTWFYYVPGTKDIDKLFFWVDNENVMHTTDFGDGKFDIDVTGIPTGFHSINLQVMDKKGWVSAVNTYLFYKVPASAKVEKLRYWIDGTLDTKEEAYGQGSFLIDVSECNPGFHFIYYYVVDAAGNSSKVQSAGFYRMPIDTRQKLYYWFAGDTQATEVKDFANGFVADVTRVQEGFNTIYTQIVDQVPTNIEANHFIKIPQTENAGDMTLACIIDGKIVGEEKVAAHGGVVKCDMDVTNMEVGLHKAMFQLITPSGVGSSIAESYFLRTLTNDDIASMQCTYTIDGFRHYVHKGTCANGVFHFDLPVEDVEDGLHRIDFMLVAENGATTTQGNAWFFKTPVGGNAITQYDYWLNDKSDDVQSVTLDEPKDPFQLIKLLPVTAEPIRSSCFHFEAKDDKPMLYAKNDIHFRFHDKSGRWVDADNQYVDYNVSQEVKDITELLSTQTFERPDSNCVKWFAFEAAPGDTIGFKSSQATSLQVFAPSGKEILSTMGDKSVQYSGTHTWETGTYYVAVHDVTGSKPSITLDYFHMDKYDVVDQDVRIVGNGGCSTITFQGNGFRDLYAVDLYTAKGDTIHSIDVGHESDASTTVTFDFTGAKLGKYNAIFHFAEENKVVANCITVEEAKDIELATKVSYPSTFLRGTSVTYTVEITNNGNMNAYCVPIFTHVTSPRKNSITRIKYEGLDLPNVFDAIEYDSLSTEEITAIEDFKKSMDDDLYFIKSTVPSENNPYDSVFVRSNYFMDDFAPYETKTYLLHINTSDVVQVYVTVPDGWNEVATYSNAQSRAKGIRKASLKDEYCCIAGQLECILSTTGYFLDMASALSIPISAAFGPEVAAAIGIADCSVGIADATNRATQAIACDPENAKKSLKDKLKSVAKASASTAATAALSCVSAKLGTVKKYLKQDIQDLRTVWSNLLSSVVAIADNAGGGTSISCESMTKPKPGCPPNPPKGGGSSPVNSYDPNDIYGYIAPSGSMYVGDEVLNMPYRIEFENDTTFATSAAHKVVVKDTLDAKVFDLASYQPTSFKIGDKDVQLKGDKEFVTTVDMRPEINAIAQVEGLYDAKKGIATWMFTSLDPMTMEPTDDIMQGFLPVNYDGRGIGEVAFNINRKPGLPDGTEIANKASIVFDSNDPILTPVWTNIVDAEPPTSRVCDLEVVSDTIVRVNFEGKDYRSGVWKYALYVQYGKGTSWNQVAETDTACFDFRYYEDIDYGFCVLATDSAGNVEPKIIEREYMFVNGEATMIDAIAAPQEKKAVTNKAYDLSGRLIQEEGYRGIVIRNRRKLLKR